MELTINQLIKIIIGIFVVVVVVLGLYFIFKNSILDFFKNLPGGTTDLVLSFLKWTKKDFY